MSSVADRVTKSFTAQDSVLNCPIVQEEVSQAINHLKTKSAGGADSLSPYHLKDSGPLLRTWLCHVFNTIVSLEEIPSSFKFGLITPIYKGKGKDPHIRGSYRGINLSSVLAKTLEFVLLERIIPVMADENIPQLTQTGFQKDVSCSDAIFSCLETISKYIREGDSVYSCFYDLASAFDTVEYPVLLHHLYKAGVVGKTWHLIKNWYSHSSSCVRISDTSSRAFPISWGVKQGSVLYPVLFLLVMDPILLALKNKPCGLNICGLYLGAFFHADDIRTLASSKLDCSHHISSVQDFASSRGLKLSVEKCEAVISPSLRNTPLSLSGRDICIPVTNAAPHLKHIVDIDTDPECNWLRVWDIALDRGPHGTSCALAMLKLLGLQSFSGNCPFGSCDHILGDEHLGTHFLLIHTELTVTLSDCELALKCLSDDIFTHVVTMYDCPVFQLVYSCLLLRVIIFNPHPNFL